MADIIRLLTTKAVAVPKISSTVRDLYGQATAAYVFPASFLDCLTLEDEIDRLSKISFRLLLHTT